MPDSGENAEEAPDEADDDAVQPGKTNALEPASAVEGGGVSEGEDIADRAASLLHGLRGDAEPADPQDNTLRVRRRREGADDERSRRRARRRNAAGSVDHSEGRASTTIAEETEGGGGGGGDGSAEAPPPPIEGDEDSEGKRLSDESPLPTPTTIVVPPSPKQDDAAED
jgi:cytokinesis protein